MPPVANTDTRSALAGRAARPLDSRVQRRGLAVHRPRPLPDSPDELVCARDVPLQRGGFEVQSTVVSITNCPPPMLRNVELNDLPASDDAVPAATL